MRNTSYFFTHFALTQLLLKLGYPDMSRGVCYGYAQMARQAIMCHELDASFKPRMEYIMHSYLQQSIAFNAEPDIALDELAIQLQQEPIFFNTSIKPFFDGIISYQAPYLISPTLDIDQDNALTEFVNCPLSLEPSMARTRHCYFMLHANSIECWFFFLRLQQAFNLDPNPKAILLTCLLQNTMGHIDPHAITLGYQPDSQTWLYVDVNDLPAIYYTYHTLPALITKIWNVFQAQSHLTCSLHAYFLKCASKVFCDQIHRLIEESTLQSLQRIPQVPYPLGFFMVRSSFSVRSKKNLDTIHATLALLAPDSRKVIHNTYYDLLLLQAVLKNNHAIATRALSRGADANKALGGQSVLPCVNDCAMLKLLLLSGADPNARFNVDNKPILFFFIRVKPLPFCHVLVSFGAELHRPFPQDGREITAYELCLSQFGVFETNRLLETADKQAGVLMAKHCRPGNVV